MLRTCVLVVLVGCYADPSGQGDSLVAEQTEVGSSVGHSRSLADELRERARIAAIAGPRSSFTPQPRAFEDSADSLSKALDLPDDVVVTPTGPQAGRRVLKSLGTIKPIQGGSFVLLSTGVAGTDRPEPGIDLGDVGLADDLVAVSLTMSVPAGVTGLTLQYNFLSAEYPDFVGGAFNDTFSVELIQDSVSRVFNVASVNSSTFFAASAERARDSGFDIVADDPAGVDNVTADGLGAPDAGLTDFQSLSAAVVGGKDVTIVLRIRDSGDAFFDSAVLIDAVRFFAIDTVDPNPALLEDDNHPPLPNTHVLSDPALLATGGRPIRGVVADGVTEVLLRMKVPAPGTMTFSIPGGDFPKDGRLLREDGPPGDTVEVTSVTVGRDELVFAVYRAPDDFVKVADDAAAAERTIQIAAAYTPNPGSNAQAFNSQIDFLIERPPVVLVRGLWSTGQDWPQSPLTRDPRFLIRYVDDTYSCNSELRVNLPNGDTELNSSHCTTPPLPTPQGSTLLCAPNKAPKIQAIDQVTQNALDSVRHLQFAATRVDMVAHGTGGLHARAYINADTGQIIQNLRSGYVNRLITINTPHFGSPVADRIVSQRSATFDSRRCTGLVSKAPVEPGDIDQLQTKAANLGATNVLSHAIYGECARPLPRDTLLEKLSVKKALYKSFEKAFGAGKFLFFPQLASPPPPSDAFGANDHDLFADIISQIGGIPAGASSRICMDDAIPDQQKPELFANGDQFSSLRSATISERVIDLLNTATQAVDASDRRVFATFPDAPHASAAAVASAPGGLAAARRSPLLSATSGGIRVVSPAAGTVVSAGDSLTVSLATEGGFVPETILVIVDQGVVTFEPGSLTATLVVPTTALGATGLFAVAFDADDNMVLSDNVQLDVTTNAALQTVQIITQDPILAGAGAERQLAVVGHYSDDVTRDITTSARGTVYRSSDARVVTVSANGLLTAVGIGIATVAAQNSNTQDSITVTVKGNARPVAKAGEDLSLTCVAPGETVPVQLDGSASSDPDGDLLTFSWQQADGTLATGATPTVELGAGEHAIALVVSDALVSSAPDIVNVSILEDTVPPSVTILGVNPQTIECGGGFSDDGATATDACDGNVTAAITVESNVNTAVPGIYSVDYRARDKALLTGLASRSVQVVDTTSPQIVCPPDQLIQTTGDTGVLDFATRQSDTCSVASVACTRPSGSATPLGPATDTCTVTDAGGNQASCSFEIFTNAPPSAVCSAITVDADALCRGSGSVDGGSFDRNGDLAACVQSPAGPYALGVAPVSLTCSDTHGGSSLCNTSITVVDRTPPEIACPTDRIVECTAGRGVAAFAADSTDNCSLASQICSPASGSQLTLGTTQGTCSATDGSGNSSSCAFRVTVRDSIAPAVATRPDPTILFPPNHRLRTFRLSDCVTSVADQCAGVLDINAVGRITRVTSDEAENERGLFGIGDGHSCNDIVITGDTSVDLRAERDGLGNGRVYTVFFDVTDANGNVSSSSCKVNVPHGAPHRPAIEDACAYCEGIGCGSCPGHDARCR